MATVPATSMAREYPPLQGGKRLFLTAAIATAAFMEILDMTIVNVSVPAISGSLGVSNSEGTWVVSSYMLTAAVIQPLSGWIARRFGEVRTFVTSVCLFMMFSALCGLATSLPMLVAARLVQADSRAYQHFLPVARREGAQHITLPEHAAAHLRALILQREIPVPGARPSQIGNFRLQPQAGESALEQHPHLPVEARHRVDVAFRAREGSVDLGRLHRQMIAVYRARGARYNAPPLERT